MGLSVISLCKDEEKQLRKCSLMDLSVTFTPDSQEPSPLDGRSPAPPPSPLSGEPRPGSTGVLCPLPTPRCSERAGLLPSPCPQGTKMSQEASIAPWQPWATSELRSFPTGGSHLVSPGLSRSKARPWTWWLQQANLPLLEVE